MSIGSSSRKIGDRCHIQQTAATSQAPSSYYTYLGFYENNNRCNINGIWYRGNGTLVDIESELRNQTRPLSTCANFKYRPGCKSGWCRSTFDQTNPIILDPSLCPIVYNNMPRLGDTNSGYNLPDMNNPNIIA